MASESPTPTKSKRASSPEWHGAQTLDFATKLKERPHPGKVRVELLTDPWSVWCWGFEPARRAIELRYPSIEFRFLLGGMFPTMPNPREVGFDVERFFGIVQRTTGMPVSADVVKRDPASSTYPSCIFTHAVRLADPSRELAFLRAMREAVYLDALNISRQEVASQIAARVGVDTAKFRDALSDGSAEQSFKTAIDALHESGLHAYPTFLITSGERTVRVEGFQTLPGLIGIAQSVSGQPHAPTPDPAWSDVLVPGERVATREYAEVFGISPEDAYDRLAALEAKGEVVRERHPTGDVWSPRDRKAKDAPKKKSQGIVKIVAGR